MAKPSAEHVSTAQKMLREYLREGVEVRVTIREDGIEIAPVQAEPAEAHFHEPCTVYRYFDQLGALLYIGIANSFAVRDEQHYKGSPWRHRAVLAVLEEYASRRIAEFVEADLIEKENPPENTKRPLVNPVPEHRIRSADPAGDGEIRVLRRTECAVFSSPWRAPALIGGDADEDQL